MLLAGTVVAGLGNPGAEYALTRHNIGFMVLDTLARDLGAPSWTTENGICEYATARLHGRAVVLFKPLTYMNRSGQAVKLFLARTGLGPENLIAVHDDIDMEFGKLRVRSGGGHGGHNGVRSIAGELGTGDFRRVKLGVGRPPEGMDAASHVLGAFTPEEMGKLPEILKSGVLAVHRLMAEPVCPVGNSEPGL